MRRHSRSILCERSRLVLPSRRKHARAQEMGNAPSSRGAIHSKVTRKWYGSRNRAGLLRNSTFCSSRKMSETVGANERDEVAHADGDDRHGGCGDGGASRPVFIFRVNEQVKISHARSSSQWNTNCGYYRLRNLQATSRRVASNGFRPISTPVSSRRASTRHVIS
jgi:hypothetical protein